MRVVSQAFIAATTIILFAVSASAQAQAAALVKPDRTVGAAEVFYLKEKNKTRAQVRVYPFGKPDPMATPGDALSMDVIFESDGTEVVRPKYVHLAFSSNSAAGPKYQKERDLMIYTEGLGGVWSGSFRTRVLSSSTSPSGGSVEDLLSSIDYERFLKIAAAHAVSLDLGKTHFVLKKEDLQALKDLNQTIEK